MASQIPLGKLGDPGDIGHTMLFLASDAAVVHHRPDHRGRRRLDAAGKSGGARSLLPGAVRWTAPNHCSSGAIASWDAAHRCSTTSRCTSCAARASGCTTPDGKRYLDAYNNVPHVGHCHPRVVAALHRQAGTLNTHTRYLDENVVAYAERLSVAVRSAALHGHVLLHRQRGERARAAHRARLQRRARRHRRPIGPITATRRP